MPLTSYELSLLQIIATSLRAYNAPVSAISLERMADTIEQSLVPRESVCVAGPDGEPDYYGPLLEERP